MSEDTGIKLPVKKAIFIILSLLLCAVAVFLAVMGIKNHELRKKLEGLTETETATEGETLPENPVDFAKLKKQNDEIYAWISIPNAEIELPVVQSRIDDLYYMKRDIDGKYSRLGSIFSQSHNSLDFSDPVTVLYGHNYITGGMFTNLHYFEDKKFFDENEFMYIYTPGHILTYRIVSAYKYDDRHILNTFDFSDPSVLREYFDYVMNPASLKKNVREGVTLDDSDRLLVLSTCLTYGYRGRYLVNGVLISDEHTK
jgi:sortase B